LGAQRCDVDDVLPKESEQVDRVQTEFGVFVEQIEFTFPLAVSTFSR
jgi:hypothetical protein